MSILLTNAAANAVASMTPRVKTIVGSFLADRLAKYVETHDPRPLVGVEGKYWVVRPATGGADTEAPALVITRRAGDADALVVTAVLDHLGSDRSSSHDHGAAALGAAALRSIDIA